MLWWFWMAHKPSDIKYKEYVIIIKTSVPSSASLAACRYCAVWSHWWSPARVDFHNGHLKYGYTSSFILSYFTLFLSCSLYLSPSLLIFGYYYSLLSFAVVDFPSNAWISPPFGLFPDLSSISSFFGSQIWTRLDVHNMNHTATNTITGSSWRSVGCWCSLPLLPWIIIC